MRTPIVAVLSLPATRVVPTATLSQGAAATGMMRNQLRSLNKSVSRQTPEALNRQKAWADTPARGHALVHQFSSSAVVERVDERLRAWGEHVVRLPRAGC